MSLKPPANKRVLQRYDSKDDDFFIHPLNQYMPDHLEHLNPQTQPLQVAVPAIANDKYNVKLDLRHFDPSEVSVKVDKNSLQVSGKREKKSEDGKHYEYHEYVHHFSVPEHIDVDSFKCKLNPTGYLHIEAPVKQSEKAGGPRNIPIEFSRKL